MIAAVTEERLGKAGVEGMLHKHKSANDGFSGKIRGKCIDVESSEGE